MIGAIAIHSCHSPNRNDRSHIGTGGVPNCRGISHAWTPASK